MRYNLPLGIVIRTENAAKPRSQASTYLNGLLSELPAVETSLDYGCGKLRYADKILEKSHALILADSEIQLSREQEINRRRTSIRRTFAGSNQVTVLNVDELRAARLTIDRAFCINVLSSIPYYSQRRRAVQTIRNSLNASGSCLFVVQYRNSDFTRMSALPNAIPWRDGFLINSLRGYSFYGLITPDSLCRLVRQEGFNVTRTVLHEGSAFMWASPR